MYSEESKWRKSNMKQLLLKGTMTTMLACSPFLAGTAAYASDNTNTEKTTETEKPTLVQGDFFYFVKTMVEDIRLALATNDLDKAKLLSEQAAERIAEARVLIQEGKDDLTQNTLEKAAENLEKADELSGGEKVETKTEDGKLTVVAADKEKTEDAAKTERAADKEKTEGAAKTERAADKEKTEDVAKTNKAADAKTKETEKVKMHIGHNIEALAKVLDKVKNPKAKAAIAKNIEKSFAKIAAKIEKEQEKAKKEELANSGESTQAVQDTNVKPETPEDTGQVTQPAQSTQPTQSAQPAQSTQPAQSAQPVQSAQPAQSTQPAQSAQPVQSAQPAQPVQKPAVSHEKHEWENDEHGNGEHEGHHEKKEKKEHEDNGKKVGHEKHEDRH
jgi:hypothetical protein